MRSTKEDLLPHRTPPSIPSGDYRFGYKVDPDEHKIISLKSLFQIRFQNENSEDYLGPGYYEAKDSLLIKKRGGLVPYKQDTSRRTNIE
jgi:hypothetical protein